MAIEWAEAAAGFGLSSNAAENSSIDAGHALADDVGREQLRRQAATLSDGTDYSRLDDHGVFVQVVATMRSRALGASHETAESLKFRLSPKPTSSSAPSSVPARSRSSEAPASAVVEPEVDVQAQVAVLQQAAKDGTPFCEECEKAKKQQAAMA
jgi:hypothetical protein